MKTRTITACITLLCWPLCGCSRTSHPVHLYIGLDTSGSARSCLGGYTVATKGLAEQLQPGQDWFTLYRLDSAASEFSDGIYDGNVETTLKTVVEEVKQPAKRDGTLPAKFWRRIVERVKQDSCSSVLFLLSDGDNDDSRAESWVEMGEAATRIAACKHVRAVVFCGARADNWNRLRKTFAPLGNRLHLLSPTQITAENVLPFLEQGQQ